MKKSLLFLILFLFGIFILIPWSNILFSQVEPEKISKSANVSKENINSDGKVIINAGKYSKPSGTKRNIIRFMKVNINDENYYMKKDSAGVANDSGSSWTPGYGENDSWQAEGYGDKKYVNFKEVQTPDIEDKTYIPQFTGTAYRQGGGGGSGGKPDSYSWEVNATYDGAAIDPDKLKLVDARHEFNYSSMDMTGKWGKGTNNLLMGVDNSDCVNLKITGLPLGWKYECIISKPSSSSTVRVLNDTVFTFDSSKLNAEENVVIKVKDTANNEKTWNLVVFSKAYRSSRITWMNGFLTGVSGLGVGFNAPNGKELLNVFMNNKTTPSGAVSVNASQSVRDSKLTHNCGASFDKSTENATIKKFRYDASSSLSSLIFNNADFIAKCRAVCNLNDTSILRQLKFVI